MNTKTIIALSILTGFGTSLMTIGIYHQWIQHQPIPKELIQMATCDRNLLIHQEAVRLAKLHLTEAERKKEITKYIVKYRKVIDAHGELIFDPQPQGKQIRDLTPQIKKEIESIHWK